MSKKITYALFDDDHVLLESAKKLVDKGVHVAEVYSPFPIHGLDPVIGVRRTRLAICAFIYGLIGMSIALLGMRYTATIDWPVNIGGKPNFYFIQNLPAFIPITFEFTVFCTAHGMALTYFLRNKTLPGIEASNPDPRTTDDKFMMEIHEGDYQMADEELQAMLKDTGAIEINSRVA